jgi:hypothetical protein
MENIHEGSEVRNGSKAAIAHQATDWSARSQQQSYIGPNDRAIELLRKSPAATD